ncbi:bifunctional homocysteine S-methyltransferase/methylenetetrahydrofolate reductase [Amycolatopsis taiwanensis]|uniref:Bifunctional homocysteine S-methyltransferase/methylenetetrahydrofolate reductase n=1 Tax=Amycolatopsis taiwanensis TaxID=342230 RepID=A0A9W6R7N3_9PSEU|nr:bifunctional homocysteine S-methyltransferase/methylenetetrahydrofolate reductase [Amycolatopsis taiwanensis]GLY70886.1 bifunctional homocysteine S-methyltransferase/methylenetetrahydrofolate reductase [Amycolatopsis taiwanensis]
MDFTKALSERILVCDGAMGTMLHAAGNSLDRALPELNLSNPELVSTVHESYVGAGVDILLTNTFGANRLRLAEHGSSLNVRDINLAGVRLARQARRGVDRTIFVGGSVSPAVSASQRQSVRADERVEVIRDQVRALVDGGVDLLVLETFGYLDELVEAVAVTAELTDLPILAQATFTAEGVTPGGESPREVASALAGQPVAALGANCTVGPQRMLTVVEELRRYSTLPISAQPNAGLPRRIGRRFEYSVEGDYFSQYARRYVEQGTSIVGGCCGTTPTHIRDIVAKLADLRPKQQRRPEPAPRRQVVQPEHGRLAQRLGQRRFVVAAQISPPAGGDAQEATELTAMLRKHGIDLVFVAARESARAQVSSVSLALHVEREVGAETIATLTTWDKTIMTLQADLLGVHAFGMRTVVCETGNPPLRGDYPNADGIWEVDSVGLIQLLAGLNDGRDCNGLTLATKTSFHIGARFNPGAEDRDAELARTRAKIAAGAQFLISRPVYEADALVGMLAELSNEDIPVLMAVSPLAGFAEAEYLAHEVPDVRIPRAALSALETAGDRGREVGLELARALLDEARPLVQGVVLVMRDGRKLADFLPLVEAPDSGQAL